MPIHTNGFRILKWFQESREPTGFRDRIRVQEDHDISVAGGDAIVLEIVISAIRACCEADVGHLSQFRRFSLEVASQRLGVRVLPAV
ncbi:hypothetical protein GCM10007880_22980 [Mesorhizobium amorphae]|nr:hypothetical protein GCM10007880_22980 [Mesorhizobium amorphae]